MAGVKKVVSSLKIWSPYLKELGLVVPGHVMVHDRSGKSIVIEWEGGETKIYDNPEGVATNAPSFPWHQKNMGNFAKMSPYENKESGGGFGNGTGMVGLPGDYTPEARFAKMRVLSKYTYQAQDSHALSGVMVHLLNTVDIPKGVVRLYDQAGGEIPAYTQWIVVKELATLNFYVRTYESWQMKKINLTLIDWSQTDLSQLKLDITQSLELPSRYLQKKD